MFGITQASSKSGAGAGALSNRWLDKVSAEKNSSVACFTSSSAGMESRFLKLGYKDAADECDSSGFDQFQSIGL